MGTKQESASTARLLERATAAEIVFLIVSAFFLFTEHRAHYLGVLPYALAVVAGTVFFWLLAERRKLEGKPGSGTEPHQPGKGARFHA